MRTGLLKKAIRTYMNSVVSVFIWGQPASAKSSSVKQVAKEDSYELIDLRLSQLDAVDLRGVPFVENGRTYWAKPSWWPKDGVKTILFLDEMNQASQSVQAPAYQLVLDRSVGEHVLPDSCRVIAAGNRQADKAIVNKMGTALKNRFVHLEAEVNNDDWTEWALGAGIHESIIGFLRFRPALLNELGKRANTTEETNRVANVMETNAFATPRSWEFLNRVITSNDTIDRDIEFDIYSGAIGAPAATEFMAYLKYYRDMPDLDQVLMNPTKAEIPTEMATLYAVATGLGMRITEDNFERAITYLERVKQQEFTVMAVQDALKMNSSLTRSRPVMKWIIDNQKIMGN